VIAAPVREILIITEEPRTFILLNRVNIRAKPYPPSFRRTAANTMDPAMGAST